MRNLFKKLPLLLVGISYVSIILFLLKDSHNDFESMVGIALLALTSLVYDIWHEVTYYEEEE